MVALCLILDLKKTIFTLRHMMEKMIFVNNNYDIKKSKLRVKVEIINALL